MLFIEVNFLYQIVDMKSSLHLLKMNLLEQIAHYVM